MTEVRFRGPRSFARAFLSSRTAVAGAVIIVVMHAAALSCPWIAPHDPTEPIDIFGEAYATPSAEHPLGTDRMARDVWSRLLWGSRISLTVGFFATVIAVVVGTLWGAVAGYFGGRVDAALMRLVDAFLAFPTIVLLITVLGTRDEPTLWVIVVVIGLMSWMGIARLVRAQFLSLREREFFLAAKSLGAGHARLVALHLIPNAWTPIIVAATLRVGNVVLLEAGLSYLGLGVDPVTAPSWGNIIYDNRGAISTAWWIPFSAGLAIVVTVVGYNLLGDGLRDVLDPRREGR